MYHCVKVISDQAGSCIFYGFFERSVVPSPSARRIPWSSAVGVGGQPGMQASTGMTLSMLPSDA